MKPKTKTKTKNKGYHYTQCGLDNVWLANGYSVSKEGHVKINDILELHEVIGMALVNKGSVLNPKEVRYIRHHMDLSQKTFGTRLGVTNQAVMGWEKGETLPPSMDKFIKTTYYSFLNRDGDKSVYDFFTELAEMDAQEHDEEIQLKEIDDRWDIAA